MLVLTRKKQQQIRIGENITITFLRVKGSTVNTDAMTEDPGTVTSGFSVRGIFR